MACEREAARARQVFPRRQSDAQLAQAGRTRIGVVIQLDGVGARARADADLTAGLEERLERAGPGEPGKGMITGLFTVLVDGDDHNEPVADAVRGILDGHIVMRRAIAERGRYPAIDVLKSVSRTLPHCMNDEQNATRDKRSKLDLPGNGNQVK